jgi:hypothetical protein
VDNGRNYTMLTSDVLLSFSLANGMISSDLKCMRFITDYPVSSSFLKREKGRLPYSVFKATGNDVRFVKPLFKKRAPTVFFLYPSYVNL